MLRSEKPKVVETLAGICLQSNSIVITHYHGLTVSQLEGLRKSLKDSGAGFKVVKNTLVKLAFTKVDLEDANHLLSGPTAIAYSRAVVDVAKVVIEFAKTNKDLKIIAGVVNNEVLDKNSVLELSKLPSLDELRGKIIGLLQAPATKLVRVIQSPASGVVGVLDSYSGKKS